MRQWGVNNLPKVVAQQRHGRTHDPWIASSTPYRLATAPPGTCPWHLLNVLQLQRQAAQHSPSHIRWRGRESQLAV